MLFSQDFVFGRLFTVVRRGKTSGNRLTGDHVRAAGGRSSQHTAPRTFGDTKMYIGDISNMDIWDIWGHHPGLMEIWGIDCLEGQIIGCVHSGTPVSNLFGRQGIAKKRKVYSIYIFHCFLGVFSHKYG